MQTDRVARNMTNEADGTSDPGRAKGKAPGTKKGKRIRHLDQSHHVLSLFRQQSDDERRKTLFDMLGIALREMPARMGQLPAASLHPSFEDAEGIHHAALLTANDESYSMPERAAAAVASACVRLLRAPAPLDPWALGHLAITFGWLDITADMRPDFAKAHVAPAIEARRKAGDPIRQAALAIIRDVGRSLTKTACARSVAQTLAKDQRNVERAIDDYFERVELPNGRFKTRPKAEFLARPR